MHDTCFLHIGAPKTGSTSVQSALFENRRALAGLGYFVPSLAANHVFLAGLTRDEPEKIFFYKRLGLKTRAEIGARIQADKDRFEAERALSPEPSLVLSCEILFSPDEASCRRLAEYLQTLAKRVQVICYVRHPLDQVISQIHQQVKVGSRTLEDAYAHPPIRPVIKTLDVYRRVFGTPAIQVSGFSRPGLLGGDVVEDFLHRIGLDAGQRALIPRSVRNAGLSREALMLADAAARTVPRELGGEWNPKRAQTLEAHLSQIRGARPGVPPQVLDRIQKPADEILSYLEREFSLILDPPELPPWQEQDLWRQQAVDDVAGKINSLSLEVQNLREQVATLRRQPGPEPAAPQDARTPHLRARLRRMLDRFRP